MRLRSPCAVVSNNLKCSRRERAVVADSREPGAADVAKKLIASGKISRNDSVVFCVTGNGLKTLDAVVATWANRAKSSRACARSRPAGA
jgi:threonine synthase